MKKSINLLSALAVTGLLFIGCGGNKAKDMLARKWQIAELKVDGYDEQMAQMKAAADTARDTAMKAQIVSQIKMYEGYMEEMKKSTLEYKSDGNFEANTVMMGQTQNVKGTWTISEDGKKVIMINDKQKADTMNVDELSAEKFVTSSETAGKKSIVTLLPAK